MEKSIKRVEKLVHATNSALAQMKLSLMFDDMSAEKGEDFRRTEGFHPTFGEKVLDGDYLIQCQKEFKSEASEVLAKIERMFSSNELSRKNSQALDRIKEINKKMKTPNMEKSEPEETQQSRQKLLSLIAEEKFSPRVSSSRGSAGSKRAPSAELEKRTPEKPPSAPKKVESLPETRKTPTKSKELKSKLLETQEIVDRGVQTARQLAHKVDSITKSERKERTPSAFKTASEANLRHPGGRTDSNETIKAVKSSRHPGNVRQPEGGSKEKIEVMVEETERQDNVRVINVKRNESQRPPKELQKISKLQLQQLPSVHIKGELQLQKIHNLEISTAGNAYRRSPNTAITYLSHDNLEREKRGETVEKETKECHCCNEGNTRGNYVECYNCGKLIRFRKTRVDPRKIDEVLQMCNFNVFDPRIEEFVEKYGGIDTSSRQEETQLPESFQISVPGSPEPEFKDIEEIRGRIEKMELKNKLVTPAKTERRHTLQNLSDQLYQKYRQETDTLEGNHVKLDIILQSLFKKIDESREVFESCHLLKNQKVDSARVANLTATKPVLVSFAGDPLRIMKKRKKPDRSEGRYLSRSKSVSPETKMDGRYEPSHIPKPSHPGGDSPAPSRVNRGGDAESETKNEIQGRLLASSTVKHPEIKKQEVIEKTPSAAPNYARKCRSHGKSKTVSRKQKTEDNPMPSGIPRPLDWIFRIGEGHIGTLATANERKPIETKKQEVVKENVQVDTSSTSPALSGRTSLICPGNDRLGAPLTVLSNHLEAGDEVERNTPIIPWGEEVKEPSDASSERSENNYESDFESTTNDPEDHGGIVEESEMFPLANKLSTITEVDSELEKKVGDESKASKRKTHVSADGHSKREGNSIASEVSSRSRRRETVVSKASEVKDTPTELVTSLKDILSALQDQFARTESLAEKLTENQKTERKENPEPDSTFAESPTMGQWEIPPDANLFETLLSARKGARKSARGFTSPEKSRSKKTIDSLSDEGGSSLGEIVLSQRGRRNSAKSEKSEKSEKLEKSEKSESSTISENSFLKLASGRRSSRASTRREKGSAFAFKLGVSSEDVSYSEGEIPSENPLNLDRFSIHSVGECIPWRGWPLLIASCLGEFRINYIIPDFQFSAINA